MTRRGYLTRTPATAARLLATIAEGRRSTGVMITSDSTAAWNGLRTGKVPWTAYFARQCALALPGYAVQVVNYNTAGGATTGYWEDAVPISGNPTARYSSVNGANALEHPGDGTAQGDLELVAKVSFPSWPIPATGTLFSRWGNTAGTCSWFLNLSTAGTLSLILSADGTTTTVSNGSSSALAATANTPIWIRVRRTNSTGVTSYETSADGKTWTAAGGGTYSAGTAPYDVGTAQPYQAGAYGNASGRIKFDVYEAEIRAGIGGPSVVPKYLDNWGSAPVGYASGSHAGQPVFTILNGSIPGASLEYLRGTALGTGGANAARLPMMTSPAWCSALHIIGTSHNDADRIGGPYLASWDAWLTSLRARASNREVMVMTENPKQYPATYIDSHAIRRLEQIGWAGKNGLAVVDVYRSFLESPWPLDTLVAQADSAPGVHETDDYGASLWGTVVFDSIFGELRAA